MKRKKPLRDPELLTPSLKAAYDVVKGDDESFDALLRKVK